MADDSFTRRIRRTEINFPSIQGAPPGSDVSNAVNNLRSSLQNTINFFDAERALENEEFQKQVDLLLEGDRAAEIEQSEEEFLERHKDAIGNKNIYAVTRGFRRKVEVNRGQVRGLKLTRELQNQVIAGKFATPDEFETAYQELTKAEIASFPDDGFREVGLFEVTAPRVDQMRSQVASLYVANQMSAARASYGESIGDLVEEWQGSPAADADERFKTAFLELSHDLMDQTPGDQIGREEVVTNSLIGIAQDDANIEFIPELVDIAIDDGHVTDSERVKQLRILSGNAKDRTLALAGRDDPKLVAAARNLVDAALTETALSGKPSDKTMRAINNNRLAIPLLNTALSAQASTKKLLENADLTSVPPTPYEIVAFNEAVANRDADGLRTMFSPPRLIQLAETPEGQQLLNQRTTRIVDIEGKTQEGANRAVDQLVLDLRNAGVSESEEARAIQDYHILRDEKAKAGGTSGRAFTEEDSYSLAQTVAARAVKSSAERAAREASSQGVTLPTSVSGVDAALQILESQKPTLQENLKQIHVTRQQAAAGHVAGEVSAETMRSLQAEGRRQRSALVEAEERAARLRAHREHLIWQERLTSKLTPDEAVNALFFNGSEEVSQRALESAP